MYRLTWETTSLGYNQQDYHKADSARDKATLLILMHKHIESDEKLTITLEKQPY